MRKVNTAAEDRDAIVKSLAIIDKLEAELLRLHASTADDTLFRSVGGAYHQVIEARKRLDKEFERSVEKNG